MRKTFVILSREYKAAIKTKSFIITLILMPVLMGGSTAVSILSQKKVDTNDKKFIILDHSKLFKDVLQQSVGQRNKYEIFDPETHEKIKPAYFIQFVEPDTVNPDQQKLELSKRVKTKDISGFFEIGAAVLHPDFDSARAYVRYYSESAFLDETRSWFSIPINNHLRNLRIASLQLSPDSIKEVFYYTDIEDLGLITIDEESGVIHEAEESNIVMAIVLPYVLVLLMFSMTMMSSMPLVTAVMEEKMEKIAEVLLAKVTPFQFMAGKVLGSTCVSLTTAVIYVLGGIITAQQLDAGDLIPYELIPWFFIYLIFFLIMTGAFMAALGSACNDNKDAQNVSFPAMLPILLPLFVIMPVLRNPAGLFATWVSLIPPFTPMLMIVRQATPVTIPAWQPIAGLVGIMLFTLFTVWAGSRIFRTGILLQGQKPTFANLFNYIFKQ